MRTPRPVQSLDDVRDVVVVARDGKPVRISDVYEVNNGLPPRSGIVAFNDRDDVVGASSR